MRMSELSLEKELLIPNRRYFTLQEVSDLCAVKPHVLRYWERMFPQLMPLRRRGNERRYRYQDVLLVRKIRELLYDRQLKMEAVQESLNDQNAANALDVSEVARLKKVQALRQLIVELEEVLQVLSA